MIGVYGGQLTVVSCSAGGYCGFIGNDATTPPHSAPTDLARFQFLLGGDEQPYFGASDP